jgi:transcriptional regulator with XRE-family HTH domain
VAKPKSQQAAPAAELIFGRELLGRYLKRSRENARVSLRYLEMITGVSNSEISKIESGCQDCRLETFIRLCAALGVSGGAVIDQVLMADLRPYLQAIATHPALPGFVGKQEAASILVPNLAVIAAFCAHLIRCSRPRERAKGVACPTVALRNVILKYARRVETMTDPAERLRLLEYWREIPLVRLQDLGCLEPAFLAELLAALKTGAAENKSELRDLVLDLIGSSRRVPLWLPFVPTPLWEPAIASPQPEPSRGNSTQRRSAAQPQPKTV